MMNKIKKSLVQAKDSAGRTFNYAKGKSSGFTHPDAVEPHVVILRANKEQIPKLYDRVQSLCSQQKGSKNVIVHSKTMNPTTKSSALRRELAASENKAHAEFQVGGGNEQENKVLLNWFKAFAECQLALSEARLIYHSVLEEVRVDMKTIKEKDLQDIQVIHDKVNHALTDARYWRKNANPAKLMEAESRYKQFVSELIDMKNRLMELKETKFPEYISNWTRAQLEFFNSALRAAQGLDEALRAFGPVPLTPTEPFNPDSVDLGSGDIGTEGEESSNYTPSAHAAPPPQQQGGYAAPPPQQQGGYGAPPARPAAGPRARANYAFTAGSPEELSFNSGDVLTIHQQNGDWWMAELNGRRGLIPSNYVALM